MTVLALVTLLLGTVPSISSKCTTQNCEIIESPTLNFTNCDADGLRTEELTKVKDPTSRERVMTYDEHSQCNDPSHCSAGSSGTGHSLALEVDGGPSGPTVLVERCYSYCIKFENFSVNSSTNPFPNLYGQHTCESETKIFLCVLLCHEMVMNCTILEKPYTGQCETLCNKSQFCNNTLCLSECNTTICDIVKDLDENFIYSSNQSSSKLNGITPNHTVSLEYYSTNRTFWMLGALEPKWLITPSGVPSINEVSAYGIIWKIEHNGTKYVAQHEPFVKSLTEDSPLFGINSNILAIPDLQCKRNVNLSYTLVDKDGISEFAPLQSQCFYGTWTPTPPQKVKANLRFSNITGELIFELWTEDLSPDQEYVTGYGMQIVSGYKQHDICEIAYKTLRTVESLNKTGIFLYVNGTSNVKEYFPIIFDGIICNYLIGVYALPHFDTSDSAISPAAHWFNASVQVPDYKCPNLSITFTADRNNVTGCANITVTNLFRSHWKSLAGVESFLPSLHKGNMFLRIIPVKYLQPAIREYKVILRNVKPTMRSEILQYQITMTLRYPLHDTIDQQENISLPALPPSEPRLMVNSDFEQNEFYLNISWKGPFYPQGIIKEYLIVINSDSNSVFIDEKIEVEGTAQSDRDEVISYLTERLAINQDSYVNVTLRAVSEYDELGAAAIETITFPKPPTQPPTDLELARIYGAAVSVVVVLLLVLLIIIAVVLVYFYKKKASSLKEDIEEDLNLEPLHLDNWEISPDLIIMDCLLGEGEFGEVYKGVIKRDFKNENLSEISNNLVAVKTLRMGTYDSLKSDFLKEIETMKRITKDNCPYVVNMVGCCTLQEPFALVLEYVPHGDLLTYLRTVRQYNSRPRSMPEGVVTRRGNDYVDLGGSPQEQIPSLLEAPFSTLGDLRPIHLVSFAYQIATGMKYLSEMGMVHRDLACRNILVGENKALKISDFGLTREDVYIKTTSGKLPLRWMAIESIVDRVFTTKSDVWSFGVVLWEITSIGGHPYSTIGNRVLLAKLLRGFRMEKPENCPEEMYEIMMKCWTHEQDERPTFSELQASLDAMLSNSKSASDTDLNFENISPYFDVAVADKPPEGPLEMQVAYGLTEEESGYPDVLSSGIGNMNFLENGNPLTTTEQPH